MSQKFTPDIEYQSGDLVIIDWSQRGRDQILLLRKSENVSPDYEEWHLFTNANESPFRRMTYNLPKSIRSISSSCSYTVLRRGEVVFFLGECEEGGRSVV